MFNNTNKKQAFTLVELLITAIVLVVLLPVAAISFSNTRLRLQSEAEVTKVMAMLRNMRNLAITNRTEGADVLSYGLKVNLDSQIITSFYTTAGPITTISERMTLEDVKVEEGTVCPQLSGGACMTQTTGELKIEFKPPYGDTQLTCNTSCKKLQVKFTNDLGKTQTITLNNVAGIPEWQ